MQIACVLIPHFQLKAEVQRRPALKGKPVIIARTSTGENVVADFSPNLKRIERGMPLAQALSLAGDAQVLEADGAFYRKTFQGILSVLLQHSPLVECPELGQAHVGLEGLEILYGGNARLVTTLGNAIPSAYGARIGVGENKFVAFLAATQAMPGNAFKAPDDAERFVRGFSVDTLPVDHKVHEKLHLFKLHTLGDIASIGVGPLQAQFGPSGKAMWEMANGVDDRPLIPIQPEDSVVESMSFPYEVAALDVLLRAVETLLRRAFGRPEMHGKFVARLTVECVTVDALTWSRTFHVREGIGDAARALAVVGSRLEAEHPQDAFERVTVTLSGFTGEPNVQPGLVRDVRDTQKDFGEVDRRIRPRTQERVGLYHVMAVHPGHPAPEMRAVQVPVDTAASDRVKPLQTPVPIRVIEEEATPTWVAFGRRMVKIAGVEDMWKINLWWMLQPLVRQYFNLACADGSRVTVFRDMATGNWFQQSY